MKIGGLQPLTLTDYPGKVAAIIFTSGCNMRCHFCYNPNLVLPELIAQQFFMPEEEVWRTLENRKKYLDAICLTGGEPLMQEDIIDFCRRLKKLGYLIKLDTNGLMPQKLAEIIGAGVIDYIAMDIKGPLNNYEKYCQIAVPEDVIIKSIGLVINSGIDYEFRSTLVRGLHDREDVVKMAEAIKGAKKYYLQNFFQPEHIVNEQFVGGSFGPKEMEALKEVARLLVDATEVRC
ncbi:MAG: anaerobic ribonucleoside-triphosphate reductase activating protein [bacterium]